MTSEPSLSNDPLPSELQARLAQGFRDMVALYRSGEVAGALAVRDRLRGELGGLIARAHDDAQTFLAADRPAEAFNRLADALELHRYDLAGLDLPIDVTASYRALGALYERLAQPLGVAAATRLATQRGRSFYAQPRGCQLPVLGGLYELLFGERRDGSFVEVGAYDGETYSNTACLADLGWRGVYVEPVPDAAEKCRRRHAANPAIAVVECAIGAAEGRTSVWQNGPVSTTLDAAHALHLEQNLMIDPAMRRIEVALRPLDAVLAANAVTPGFDLLVVDVEGGEDAVFAGFDVARWRPRLMLVELIEDLAMFTGHDSLIAIARGVRARLARHGYREIYRDPINTLFRAPD